MWINCMQIDLHHLRREVGKTHMSPSWFQVLVLDQNFQRKQAEKTGDVSETRDVPNFHWKSSEERPQRDNHTTWWNSFQIEKYEHLMNIFQNSKTSVILRVVLAIPFLQRHSYSERTSKPPKVTRPPALLRPAKWYNSAGSSETQGSEPSTP